MLDARRLRAGIVQSSIRGEAARKLDPAKVVSLVFSFELDRSRVVIPVARERVRARTVDLVGDSETANGFARFYDTVITCK